MNQDFSIVHLLLNASWVVQLVVLLLLGVSVASWAAIFRKVLALKRVNQLNDDFERDFWSGKSLNELFSAATQNAKLAGPMEDRKSTRLNSSHIPLSRMPSSA